MTLDTILILILSPRDLYLHAILSQNRTCRPSHTNLTAIASLVCIAMFITTITLSSTIRLHHSHRTYALALEASNQPHTHSPLRSTAASHSPSALL